MIVLHQKRQFILDLGEDIIVCAGKDCFAGEGMEFRKCILEDFLLLGNGIACHRDWDGEGGCVGA